MGSTQIQHAAESPTDSESIFISSSLEEVLFFASLSSSLSGGASLPVTVAGPLAVDCLPRPPFLFVRRPLFFVDTFVVTVDIVMVVCDL